jgi:GNAT superfamily N-acetyltransferase
VLTRPAVAGDVPVLMTLWNELRSIGGRAERAVNPVAVSDVAERFRVTIGDPACRVVLAMVDGEPAGMAVLRVTCPDPMSESRVVQGMHVIVAGAKRRRGVGHALLAAAADFADEHQVEHLTTGVYPSVRDGSRFYARLGFAPVILTRAAPVAVVRRRLTREREALRVEHVVRMRTRLRRPVPPQRVTPTRSEPLDRT